MNVKNITKKNKAQAMVEFAIVLPILLLLLYGILEAGRLLFIYSTIVTASRQAVRYGSATGQGTRAVPRYQD
jgi:Flp pilus assembly protein TadG